MPIYKDAERFLQAAEFQAPPRRIDAPLRVSRELPSVRIGPPRPNRRIMGDATYTGSEYGLGKPIYNGIGTHQEWGLGNP